MGKKKKKNDALIRKKWAGMALAQSFRDGAVQSKKRRKVDGSRDLEGSLQTLRPSEIKRLLERIKAGILLVEQKKVMMSGVTATSRGGREKVSSNGPFKVLLLKKHVFARQKRKGGSS